MNKINEVIARLDRHARSVGLPLTERGVNVREFTLPDGSRILKYRPGGLGVVKVESLVWNGCCWEVDAIAHRTQQAMEKMFNQLKEP